MNDEKREPETLESHPHREHTGQHSEFERHEFEHHHIPADPPTLFASLPPEPPARRMRQYAVMFVCAVLIVVFGVWLLYGYAVQRSTAEHNAAAAKKLCRQLVGLGQACADQPVTGPRDEVANQAAVPAPTDELTGSPLPAGRVPGDPAPTDENGIPQAYQPSEGALIISVSVQEGRLILNFDDGARLDAGAVNEDLLSIVLRQLAPSASVSVSPSPSPSPVPEESFIPPGADAPDPPAQNTPEGAPT